MRGLRVLPVRVLAQLIRADALTPDQVVSTVLWMDEVDQTLAAKAGRRAHSTPSADVAASPMGGQ